MQFKCYHYAILDLTEEEEMLEQEYAIFNEYDGKVTTFTFRIQQLKLMAKTKSSSVPAADLSQCLLRSCII